MARSLVIWMGEQILRLGFHKEEDGDALSFHSLEHFLVSYYYYLTKYISTC